MQIARATAISSYIAGAAQPFNLRAPEPGAASEPCARPPAGSGELMSFMQRLNDAAILGATPRSPRGRPGA
jgi:hypothetical protein